MEEEEGEEGGRRKEEVGGGGGGRKERGRRWEEGEEGGGGGGGRKEEVGEGGGRKERGRREEDNHRQVVHYDIPEKGLYSFVPLVRLPPLFRCVLTWNQNRVRRPRVNLGSPPSFLSHTHHTHPSLTRWSESCSWGWNRTWPQG